MVCYPREQGSFTKGYFKFDHEDKQHLPHWEDSSISYLSRSDLTAVMVYWTQMVGIWLIIHTTSKLHLVGGGGGSIILDLVVILDSYFKKINLTGLL